MPLLYDVGVLLARLDALTPGATLPAKLGGAQSAGTGAQSARIDHQHGRDIEGSDGTTDAPLGMVGEYMESVVLPAAALNLTSNVPFDVTSLTVQPGDWDMYAVSGFVFDGVASISKIITGASNVSGVIAGLSSDGFVCAPFVPSAQYIPCGISPLRVKVTIPTTFYLVANAVFTLGTVKVFGEISARRVR